VLLFAGALWATDTGLMVATLAIYALYVYLVYIHVPMVKELYPHLPADEFFTYQTFQILSFMVLLHMCMRIAVRRLRPSPLPLIMEKENEEGKDTNVDVSIEAPGVKSEEGVGVQGIAK